MTFYKDSPHINRAGRPMGAKGKTTLMYEAMDALPLLTFEGDYTPLQFLHKVMHDNKVPLPLRIRCAESAAPYVHRRMPLGIDNGQGGPITVVAVQALVGLDLSKLLQMEGLMSEIGGVDALTADPSKPVVGSE